MSNATKQWRNMRRAWRAHAATTTASRRITAIVIGVALTAALPFFTGSSTVSAEEVHAGMTVRLNAGGEEFSDANGAMWTTDADAPTTRSQIVQTDQPVKGDVDQRIAQTQRRGDFAYVFDVPDGTYRVHLMMAAFRGEVGSDVFRVRADSTVVVENEDIVKSVGTNVMLKRSFEAATSKGRLRIAFEPLVGEAMVNGIELQRIGDASNAAWSADAAAEATANALLTSSGQNADASSASVAAAPTTAPSPQTTVPMGEFVPIFSEEFAKPAAEGAFLSTYRNFAAYPSTWPDTSRQGRYDPNIISVADGRMRINLRTENGVARVAAPMPRINQLDELNQLYGRYEVRFRADPIAGYKTAWLLWPKSEVWPRDGEIDFPEGNLNGNIAAFTHFQGGTHDADQEWFTTNARYTEWHVAATEWRPGSITYLLDGKVVGKTTKRVPNTPMRWVLQTETDLAGKVPPESRGAVEIDYVKVWKYRPS